MDSGDDGSKLMLRENFRRAPDRHNRKGDSADNNIRFDKQHARNPAIGTADAIQIVVSLAMPCLSGRDSSNWMERVRRLAIDGNHKIQPLIRRRCSYQTWYYALQTFLENWAC